MLTVFAVVVALAQAPSVVEPPAVLPGAPREVSMRCSTEGCELTWAPPATSGATPLSGFVVLVGETPTHVAADATRAHVPADAAVSAVSVASMNSVGCSLPVRARIELTQLAVLERRACR